MSRETGAGLIVTVAGPDGSGKSTLCDALEREFSATRPVLRLHGRPHLLPQRGTGVATDPHGSPPFGQLLSAAKVAYLFVDFTVGWLVRLRPVASQGGVVIVERGWWDMLVDPKRYRLYVAPGLIRQLGKLQPCRGLLLVLEAPAQVLASRKSELTEDEIARQADGWRKLDVPGTTVVFLDASRTSDQLVTDAVQAIDGRIGPAPNSAGLPWA